ncbi:MAG: transcription-repair coupling factor [Lactovum sp.]
MNIRELFNKNREIQTWQSGFSKGKRTLLTGFSGTNKHLLMVNAYLNFPDKYIIITDNQYHANEFVLELSELLSEDLVHQFFSDDSVFSEFAIASKDRTAYRLDALKFLLDPDKTGFLIIPWMAMRTYLPSLENFQESYLRLELGDSYPLLELKTFLVNLGFESVQRVMTPGEFSYRGDIVDIYPLDSEYPIRLEFFGDELERIRSFDADSQKSLQQVDSLELSPASEILLKAEEVDNAVNFLSTQENKHFEDLIATSKHYFLHQDIRKFLEFYYKEKNTLWDYFPKHTQIFIDDFQKINEINYKIEQDLADFILSEKTLSRNIEGQTYLADNILELRNRRSMTYFSSFQKGLGNLKFDELYAFNQHSMQQFFGQMELLKTEVDRFIKQKYSLAISGDEEKISKALENTEIDFVISKESEIQENKINLLPLNLSSGFVFLEEKFVLITESELFGKVRKKRPPRLNITNAERLKDYNELSVGDYVVHRVHGIGKYLGIETLEISGLHQDYLRIEYQKGDTISIPIHQVESLSKYSAGEGKIPKISRLNDGRWKNTYRSAQKQIEDISEDLLKLYAERQAKSGFAFLEDDEGQKDFDEAFGYVETADQLRSIQEVKRDMEQARPMDRLVIGDVGFGKTEVAMRAAFKAINSHKQVAVLVPTTVLAEQHYQTMSERFVDFGVNIAVLSRFQTKSEQAEIISKLKKGHLDLIVSTHRLLSKDVEFLDLGLIIIDEEQRFGVKHKERLKELKKQVDVLTLTATPIPRTLHMSMLGIRDLSVIETPPTNRYPVQTYVMEQNYAVIRDALLREISRGGQAFYVYNRVENIENKLAQLEELIPEARITFIHGKMSELELEKSLLSFIAGEYDLLVSTTIIETGVDIPNANTLFIENADKFGLSQLYQLRGRVGRTNRVAYAYMMYQPEKTLSEVSEKRLEAIKNFTELGSGFKIAMRDLSIRGAGNLLGAEQSGFIDTIGYELYSQLLEEAVQKGMGNEQKEERTICEIRIHLDAFLPESYIQDERQKIEIYKRMHQIKSREDYEQLDEELLDRFGTYPDEVAYLLEISLLKYFADIALVQKIEKSDRDISVILDKKAVTFYQADDYFKSLAATQLQAMIAEEKGQVVIRFQLEKMLIFCLQEISKVLEELAKNKVSRET